MIRNSFILKTIFLTVNSGDISNYHSKNCYIKIFKFHIVIQINDQIALSNTMLNFLCHAMSYFWGLKAKMFYRNSTWVLHEHDISVSSTHGSQKKTSDDNVWQ